MKYIKTVTPLLLSFTLLCLNLFAQYDAGTIIYSQTNSTSLTSIQKNYIVEDFDGDNYADIILVKSNEVNIVKQLTWYKGDGSGNFTPTNHIILEYTYSGDEVFYDDMNGDGINDIVIQDSDTSFKTLLNDGQGNISAQIDNEVVVTNLYRASLKEVADIDGDGDGDVLFIGETRNSDLNIYRQNCLLAYNDGSGNFSNYNYLNDDETRIVTLIETGDIDGDGDLDIIYSGNENIGRSGGFNPIIYLDTYVRAYENAGINNFIFKQDLDIPTSGSFQLEPFFAHIKVEDLNGDDNEELLIEYAFFDQCEDMFHIGNCVYFYEFYILDYNTQNDTFTVLEEYNSWLHGYPLNANFSSSADFYRDAFLIQFEKQDSNNNLDILSVNVPQGRLQWYLGDGNGNFNITQVVNTNNQYSNIPPTLRVADIDNDTDLDIFVLLNDDSSSTLTIFKNLVLTPACAPVLDLANNSLTNGTYQAGTTLTFFGNIVAGNNVVLKAGNNVKLQTGFKAPATSTLKVRISSCN